MSSPTARTIAEQARAAMSGCYCTSNDGEPYVGGRPVTNCKHRREAEAIIASAITAATAAQEAELGGLRHEASLIEADTQRGITDSSTPLFQRVRNIVEALEKAEARLTAQEAEIASLRAALERHGVHHSNCHANPVTLSGPGASFTGVGPCNCGLASALGGSHHG